MTKMTQLTPLLKQKVDELFLHWFSEVETQAQLRKDLAHICGDTFSFDTSPRPSSPTGLSQIGLNINARPSSPPIPPGSPTATPRSPRRRTNSTKSKQGSRKSLRQSNYEEKQEKIYAGCAKNIKPFYFPFGEPVNESDNMKSVEAVFDGLKDCSASLQDFENIIKACNYPMYWKQPAFNTCGGTKDKPVSFTAFSKTWSKMLSTYHDEASKFFYLLDKDKKGYLEFDDFECLLQDIINTHPGLQFLVEAPEFHSRYIITVIARIFYCINRSWNGRITLPEFRRSNFLAVLRRLEEEEDINQIVEYFSYEHFYVIYCKFWELDTDHDMIINKQDLSRYLNGALSSIMLDRLFTGCVTRGSSISEGTMSYVDFTWFILSEVDKTTPTGIEYWFRCMDLDGNGVITMYEMQYFYEEQIRKMEDLGMETLAFEDCLCQMFDLVKPQTANIITLRDIKRCKLAPVYFDTFFNLDKWLEHEQKDPFQASRDDSEQEQSVWDRYITEEYELLVAEEGGGLDVDYEDDFEGEDDLLSDDVLQPINTSLDDLGPRWSIVSAVNDGDSNDDDETF